MAKDIRKRASQGQAQHNGQQQGNGTNKADSAETEAENRLHARLARLEQLQLSQATGSNNDVYKFAFFFVMGMVLTVLVYPKISATLHQVSDTDTHIDKLDIPDESVNGFILNDDAADESSNDILDNIDMSKPNKSKTIRDSASIDKVHDQMPFEEEVHTGRDTRKQGDSDTRQKTKEAIRVIENGVHNLGTGDLMEVEIDMLADKGRTNDESKADASAWKDTKTTKNKPVTNMLDDDQGEEVPLFRVDMNDEELSSEKVQDTKASTDNKKPKGASDKDKKKAGTGKASQKNNKTNKKSKGDKKHVVTQDEIDSDLPPEIKNFKATYQKDVAAKKIFVDGRRIPPVELLPQKPNNSSVR